MNFIATIAALLTALHPIPAAETPEQLSRTGQLYTFWYDESADIMVSEIHTDDGNVWTIEDYVAPRGSEVIVTFDTNGTQDPADDLPVQIASLTHFYVER